MPNQLTSQIIVRTPNLGEKMWAALKFSFLRKYFSFSPGICNVLNWKTLAILADTEM